jgi:hypothetical protein
LIAAAATIIATSAGVAPAAAISGVPGGTQAPSASLAGGSEFGATVAPRPFVARLSVPSVALAGAPPRVSVQITEAGVGTVYVQVTITLIGSRRSAVSAVPGWVRTGRAVSVRWPAGATLTPGSYRVAVAAHDHHGGSLLRGARSAGVASLSVTAPAPRPLSAPPAPSPAPSAPTPASSEPGVQTPAQTAAAGAVFLVAGQHSFGGPENRFGAPRGGHVHEGQDVLAVEGTALLAPIAGTISSTSYQAAGAGYYIVEHTAVGLDFMFAHCQAGSFLVSAEQVVSAGQQICRIGQTGDATAPHVHFEVWVGGWQSATGHPIDPLPYLEAWDHTPPSG